MMLNGVRNIFLIQFSLYLMLTHNSHILSLSETLHIHKIRILYSSKTIFHWKQMSSGLSFVGDSEKAALVNSLLDLSANSDYIQGHFCQLLLCEVEWVIVGCYSIFASFHVRWQVGTKETIVHYIHK